MKVLQLHSDPHNITTQPMNTVWQNPIWITLLVLLIVLDQGPVTPFSILHQFSMAARFPYLAVSHTKHKITVAEILKHRHTVLTVYFKFMKNASAFEKLDVHETQITVNLSSKATLFANKLATLGRWPFVKIHW